MSIRPKSIERWSPNFRAMDPGRKIDCVIIHATAGSKDSALEWLCSPKSQLSAHYLIDKFGGIYHLVHEQNVAWHAGESWWNGKPSVNEFSVGIELENANDGKDSWPAAQLKACADLTGAICLDHAIGAADVVGHLEVALPPGRKTDPAGFPWPDFFDLLNARMKDS